MLTSFIQSSKKQGKINPQEFWALREFYSPGELSIHKEATTTPFLTFQSPHTVSYESLIHEAEIPSLSLKTDYPGMEIDYRTPTELIAHDSLHYQIMFIKPISEMVKANAVYDYKDKDKIFLKDKQWYVKTYVSIK